MPRSTRKMSNTKTYHIIIRGNDKQDIFFDKQDYNKFIKEIKRTKEKYHYQLYAYCLMTNHVHLIVYDKDNNLSKAMQSLILSYSIYFGKKYEKVGHLVQGRFLSKNVESRKYLIQLCRYIHQNPVKAKIAKVNEYKWSSYQEYINFSDKIIEYKKILSLFGNNNQEAIKNFITFHNIKNDDLSGKEKIEYEMVSKLTDQEVKERIEKILKIDNITKIKKYNLAIRNEKIRELRKLEKTSMAQIARVLGISKRIVEKAMREKRK